MEEDSVPGGSLPMPSGGGYAFGWWRLPPPTPPTPSIMIWVLPVVHRGHLAIRHIAWFLPLPTYNDNDMRFPEKETTFCL